MAESNHPDTKSDLKCSVCGSKAERTFQFTSLRSLWGGPVVFDLCEPHVEELDRARDRWGWRGVWHFFLGEDEVHARTGRFGWAAAAVIGIVLAFLAGRCG